MAKIRARGALQIAASNAYAPHGRQYRFVLRSDHVLLRRINEPDLQSGYTVFGKLPNAYSQSALDEYLKGLGYEVVR